MPKKLRDVGGDELARAVSELRGNTSVCVIEIYRPDTDPLGASASFHLSAAYGKREMLAALAITMRIALHTIERDIIALGEAERQN